MFNQDEVLPHGIVQEGARVHRSKRAPRNPTSKSKSPWELQNMRVRDEWIGINAGPPFRCPPEDILTARSDWGGIVDERMWLEAYHANVTQKGSDKKIGRWLSKEGALRLVKGAIDIPALVIRTKNAVSGTAGDELAGDNLGNRTAWDSAAGCWVPKAGCVTDYSAKSFTDELRREYGPGSTHGLQLLPIVLEPHSADEKDTQALNHIFQGYLDAGAIVEWPAEKGLPTVVTPVAVVWQGTPGKQKPRVIVDYRYVNGAIPATPLTLPSVLDIARGLKQGDTVSKEDLKTGYHQIRMRMQDRHLCTTIWRGKLYAFTCMTFGLRDAPGEFQRRTEYAAAAMKRSLRLPLSEVYLDDFVQVCQEEVYEHVIAEISGFGFIMGKKKCASPATKQEVLGLEIDTANMTITAPEAKIATACAMLSAYSRATSQTTLELAKILGVLVSIEPAVPQLLLYARPLYDDLKEALVRDGELGAYEGFRLDRHGATDSGNSTYAWKVTTVDKSVEAQNAAKKIAKSLPQMNGQSISRCDASVVVRTDASETGIGGRAFVLNEDNTSSLIVTIAAPLPPWLISQSSTVREAYAFATVCKLVPKKYVEGRVIAGVTDNQALSKRFWVGSRDAQVNEYLTDLADHLKEYSAAVHRMMWTKRENLDCEDALSRKNPYVDAEISADRRWFEKWWNKAEPRPTIDAFASYDDAQLNRYAAVDNTGTHFDGASVFWASDEAPWFFPPLPLVTRALRNWIGSHSRASYWCLPRVAWGPWHAVFKRPDLKVEHLVRDVPTNTTNKNWKFTVIKVSKC